MTHTTVLVVAEAPVAGLAKIRLSAPATLEQAAGIAAASLLDTLDAAESTPDSTTTVAWTGELGDAVRAEEIWPALELVTVVAQRASDFGEQFAAAHADVGAALPARDLAGGSPGPGGEFHG